MNSADTDLCEVCAQEEAGYRPDHFDGVHQRCPRCGEFKLSGTAGSMLRTGIGGAKRARLSGWVREQNNAGSVPMITTNVLENVFKQSNLPIADRAFLLLREAERGLTSLGANFKINHPRFIAATYSTAQDEVFYLFRMLKELGYMDARAMGGECEILPAGYIKLDELRRVSSSSAQGFVAMWFDPSLEAIYNNGFQEGVFRAGYNPVRIDRVEHINRIDDEIIRQINASKFLVADFTGHRGGVYFEAGYALGKAIPVFWTCRKTDLGNLHFDIRQFNCIDWDSSADLANRLATRLEAVLGPGPRKTDKF